jgi:uncharacterized protein (DUF934 family)
MPRRLLLNGEIALDEWRTSSEAGEEADTGPLLLTLAEWQQDEDRWLSRRAPLGIILSPADAVELTVPHLARFALIAAEFPGPSEGRGYTQGRLLRERYSYAGELRARGHIGIDQVFFLARCGFNSLELPESDLEAGALALSTFSYAYQRSNDRGLAVPPAHRT